MSDFFAPFRSLPQTFIDLGALVPVTLSRAQAGTFDPKALGKPSEGTRTALSGHGVLSTRRTVSQSGALIMNTITKLTVEPKIGDRLTIGGTEYEVKTVSVIAPDGTPIMFEAVLS